ncbi:MAG: biotin transporter BioY [Alphaproteobacteria bacterium]|nr:biotin transporter BioY [Alphaproteobacteria bacterium]
MTHLHATAPRQNLSQKLAGILDWSRQSRVHRLAKSAILVLLGSLTVGVAAQISVPLLPVPVTLQSLAVMLVGAALGWRLGFAALVAYLVEGAVGLPVFSPVGAPGLLRLIGPTAGFLVAMPFMAAIIGFGVRRFAQNGARPIATFLVTSFAAMVTLIAGTVWLSHFMGAEKSIAVGFIPFILIEICKAGLAAAIVATPHYAKKLFRAV